MKHWLTGIAIVITVAVVAVALLYLAAIQPGKINFFPKGYHNVTTTTTSQTGLRVNATTGGIAYHRLLQH